MMKTEDKILKHLLAGGAPPTIRALSKEIGADYKITHTAVKRLAARGVLREEAVGRAIVVSLAGKDAPEVVEAERKRGEEFLLRDKGMRVLVEEVRKGAGTPFFILLLFGSRAKGTAKKGSDIDLMFVFPDCDGEFEKRAEDALALLPLRTHPFFFRQSEFARLAGNTGNVASEAIKSCVVLHGAEAFHSLLGKCGGG